MEKVILTSSKFQIINALDCLRIGGKKVYMPTPTWGNHGAIFKDCGMETASYRYFDKSTNGLDFKGMIEDLKVVKEN